MKKGMYKFLSIISSFCLCMFFFIVPVSAESDIYYPDPYSYTAYYYFIQNGYSDLILTTSGNVTYNVNLDNIGSNNGSISGTDALSGSSHETGTVGSNGSATLGSKYMTCTTNNNVSGTQTYSCYFSSSSYGVNNSQSINIQMNENTYEDFSNVDVNVNESINQRINTDITGTITSSTGSSHYELLPWLKGSYTSSSGYDANKRLWLDDSVNDVYMIFYTKTRIRNNDRTGVTIIKNSGDLAWRYSLNDIPFSGLYLNVFHIVQDSGSGNVSISFDNLGSNDVLPLFYGAYNSMPDNVAELARLRLSVGYLLNKGNDNTNSSVSNANNANNQVSQKIGQFDNIENNSVNDMSSKINNLNVTPDIIANSKFISSAAWVKRQFDSITVGTPIGSVLAFSLILGIALIFVGKYR